MGIVNNVLAGSSGQATGYNLTRSLRFRKSASAYLNRTFTTPTSNTRWTWSSWIKRGQIGSGANNNYLFDGGDGSSNNFAVIQFTNNDAIQFSQINGGSYNAVVLTDAVYRDPSAWYHVMVVYDSPNATSTDRVKIYVNGVQQTVSYGVGPFAQNTASKINSAIAHYISKLDYASLYFDGYMAEQHFIDGQALTPSSFGETSATTGVWQPKKYAGTYGTNGFYLPFTDNSALTSGSNAGLGKDFSGNGNYWTTNNISITSGATYDSMTDVPTLTSATAANFATLNPIFNPNGTIVTYSDANLAFSHSASAGNATKMTVLSTISLPASKTYWEYTVGATVNDQLGIGTMLVVGGSADGTAGARYLNDGTFQSGYTNPSTAASYTTNDIIGMAYDQPNGTLAFYKNNSLQGTITNISTSEVFFALRSPNTSGSGGAGVFNFGQRPFAYTPPTGFVALNTYNLPTPTIGATASSQANKYMDVSLWTGTGSTLSVTNSGNFSPDLVWIKCRNTYSHSLFDTNRGVTNFLSSDTTDAQTTEATSLTSFNANGFGLGAFFPVNRPAYSYVGWQWKASDSTAVTNTDGSITSTVSANTTSGFSVVTFTAPSSSGGFTVGHGLGVAPSMIITKQTNSTSSWWVWNKNLSNSNSSSLRLNSTDAVLTSDTSIWNNTNPTSTVFSLTSGYYPSTSGTAVAYCFAEVAGFSKFGSYTGNGSTDGTFVYTGFRPKYVMFKRTDTTGNWEVFDGVRNPYNVTNLVLEPNNSNAEYTGTTDYALDLTSNGFKFRGTGSNINASGGTYIYMAFAENPFKYSLAR